MEGTALLQVTGKKKSRRVKKSFCGDETEEKTSVWQRHFPCSGLLLSKKIKNLRINKVTFHLYLCRTVTAGFKDEATAAEHANKELPSTDKQSAEPLFRVKYLLP